jgi:hypothetical protein
MLETTMRWFFRFAVAAVALMALTGCSSKPCVAPKRFMHGRCLLQCSGHWCDETGDVVEFDAVVEDTGRADVQDAPVCDGAVACNGRCVSTDTDPNHCGACGRVCPGVSDATATCARGTCGFECHRGFHRCGATCLEDRSPLSCGTMCTPCTAPAGATARCTSGACDWECNPGYERVGAGCEVRVPRPLAPLSTSVVTSQQPTFRWQLAPGTQGAAVEICRDRAFTRQCQTLDAPGDHVAPPSALSPGLWFWRLRGRAGGTVGLRTGPIWQFTVGVRSAAVDTSWGSILDINGDGYPDLVVGAQRAGSAAGAAYVYLGSATGLQRTPALTLTSPDRDEGFFGFSVANAGDVNGDGYADVLVGASGVMNGTGRAYLYLGSATGLASTPAISLTGPDGEGGWFGASLANAGDVNSDGYADVVVGAAGVMSSTGRAYLYLGSATGLEGTPARTLTGPDGAEGAFGYSVASAGDVNGDGYTDVVVGAQGWMDGTGRVYLYFGSASGLASTHSRTLTGPDGVNGSFGASVASAGDVNGDGYADVLIGAVGAMLHIGRVHLFLGSATGLASTPAVSLTGPDGIGGEFGMATANAGDVNRDGYADVVVGAYRWNGSTGRAYLYLGSATGLVSTPSTTFPAPDGSGGSFGWSVAGLGDLNGDGHADLAIAAHSASGGSGRVHLFPGSATGPVSAPAFSLSAPDGSSGFGNSLTGR